MLWYRDPSAPVLLNQPLLNAGWARSESEGEDFCRIILTAVRFLRQNGFLAFYRPSSLSSACTFL